MANQTKDSSHVTGYGTIFVILALFTGLEVMVATYLPEPIKIAALVILAISKAILVALYFMHLKSDSRVFAFPLIMGIVVAIPLILVIAVTMPGLR